MKYAERILDCRLGLGVTEEDFLGASHSAAFCHACVALAEAVTNGSEAIIQSDPKLVQVFLWQVHMSCICRDTCIGKMWMHCDESGTHSCRNKCA